MMRSCAIIAAVALVTLTALLPSIDAYAGSPLSAPGAPAARSGSAELKRYAGFPVVAGEVGPIAPNNPRQEPFACETQHTDLGQPVVDNQAGNGYPVTGVSGNVIGYSADCGAPSIVKYYYLPAGSSLDGPLEPYDVNQPPTNVAEIDVGRHHNVPMIVRYEAGTINRFIYAIAVITPHPSKNPNRVDLSAWNRDLIFLFGGDTGIGHDQASGGHALDYVQGRNGQLISPTQNQASGRSLLENGYALVSSTGDVAGTTYNLRLMGQTAVMVKEQFISHYGRPRFTFAIGDSGGAVQQLAYAQDFPGLLDGLMLTRPFPDMITQVNPVGDCDLLEFYFDQSNAYYYGGALDPFWNSWTNRQLIEGMAGINGFQSQYAPPGGEIPWAASAQMGSDVCVEGWFGALPFVLNPYWPEVNPDNLPQSQMAGTYWDFFDDLKDIFGVNPANGFAYQTFDNVGVQYGLLSLRRGEITPDEFLNNNAGVGGWMKTWEMGPPGQPFVSSASFFDPWSYHDANDVASPGFTGIAPRTVGDISAIQAAYRSGLVFMGAVNIPIISIMEWGEPELNEHASREVFAIRQRLIDARGNADNQVIWGVPGTITNAELKDFFVKALDIETRWLLNHKRPADAMDACYEQDGTLIAQGPNVWNGQMNGAMDGNPSDDPSPGACTQQFPIYSSPRVLAGDAISEMTFKCALKPVSVALTDGTYGSVTFTAAQVAYLEQIFPTGVCDYSQPDQGRPDLPLRALIRVIHRYQSE